jgi:4-amino-4-deoxy-L-arabinose transferase-like glycosyltransferase
MYLFQGRIFASGRLTAPAPPLPEFFRTPFAIFDDGRWYSQYPPGFPALLAFGVRLGAPWLVNPALIALSAVIAHRLARRLAPEPEARLAGIFAGLSPFAVMMAGDYTSNPASLFFASLFLLGAHDAMRRGAAAPAALAGLAGGACVAVRPFSAVAVCSVVAVACAATLLRRRAWRAVAAAALGAALPLGAFALYNLATNGDPLVLGYTKLHGARSPGALPLESGWDAEHWLFQIHKVGRLLAVLNKDLFQLPLPGLALALAHFVLRRASAFEWALGLSVVALAGFHVFVPASSFYLGPRYLFEGLVPLAILSARGAGALLERLRAVPLGAPGRRTLLLAAALAIGIAMPAAVVARARVVRRGYSDPAVLVALARQAPAGPVLVFVPRTDSGQDVACFAANAPDLGGRIVCARDLGAENARLRALLPARAAYRWQDGRLVPEP